MADPVDGSFQEVESISDLKTRQPRFRGHGQIAVIEPPMLREACLRGPWGGSSGDASLNNCGWLACSKPGRVCRRVGSHADEFLTTADTAGEDWIYYRDQITRCNHGVLGNVVLLHLLPWNNSS